LPEGDKKHNDRMTSSHITNHIRMALSIHADDKGNAVLTQLGKHQLKYAVPEVTADWCPLTA